MFHYSPELIDYLAANGPILAHDGREPEVAALTLPVRVCERLSYRVHDPHIGNDYGTTYGPSLGTAYYCPGVEE